MKRHRATKGNADFERIEKNARLVNQAYNLMSKFGTHAPVVFQFREVHKHNIEVTSTIDDRQRLAERRRETLVFEDPIPALLKGEGELAKLLERAIRIMESKGSSRDIQIEDLLEANRDYIELPRCVRIAQLVFERLHTKK